jgi:hypothetical protein
VSISSVTGKIDGEPVRLTNGAGADRRPSVDRRGHVVFQVSTSYETMFALALDSQSGQSAGTIDRLATGWEFAVHRGSVSRDGRVLAYPRHRPNASELWFKDLRTGEAHHLVTTPATQLNPIASDDGSQVAYTVIEDDRSAGRKQWSYRGRTSSAAAWPAGRRTGGLSTRCSVSTVSDVSTRSG